MVRAAGVASKFSEGTRAIVVGVSDYVGSGLPNLPHCEAEAVRIAGALSSPNCCAVPADQITLIPDPQVTAAALLTTIKRAAETATEDTILIVYFAGHGENDRNGFVLRTGPRRVDADRGITREDLAAALSTTAARGVLVVLDCCGGAGFAERAPDFFYGLAGHDFRLMVSASRTGQSSWELEDKGSLFTSRLLRALRGEDRIGDGGSIYFSDLFDYIYSGVLADAKSAFGDARSQTPIFAGSYAADPLLFLNRDLTLAQVRVRTARITRDVLRRRVLGAAGGVLAAVLVLVGGYWAFLDSHQYFDVRSDNIALVHGYPGLSGFGLPRDEWVYAEGPSSLKSSNVLAARRKYVFDRQASPEAVLREALDLPARARVSLWLGDAADARQSLLQVAVKRQFRYEKDLEFLSDLVGAADKATLEDVVSKLQPADPIEPVLALKALDPSAAIAAFQKSAAAKNFGMQLGVLAKWSGNCSPTIQAWLDGLLTDPNASLAYGLVAATVASTKGCAIALPRALEAPQPRIRDALFALRMTNESGVAQLKAVVETMLNSPAAEIRKRPEHFGRLAAYWRYLDVPGCGDWLFERRQALDKETLLNVIVAAGRGCHDYSASVDVNSSTVTLEAKPAKGAALTLSLAIGSGSLIPIVSAILDSSVIDRNDVLFRSLPLSVDAEERTFIVQKARRLGATARDPFAFQIPDAPELDRELVRWLAATNAMQASKVCADLILKGQRSSAFLGVLALIPLADADRKRLLLAADAMDLVPRTILATLIGTSRDATDLLNAMDPRVRALAGDYLLARKDRAEVLAAASARSTRADLVIKRAEDRLVRIAALKAELAATPDFALSWRVSSIQQSEIESDGLSLALEQLLDAERQLALSRP